MFRIAHNDRSVQCACNIYNVLEYFPTWAYVYSQLSSILKHPAYSGRGYKATIHSVVFLLRSWVIVYDDCDWGGIDWEGGCTGSWRGWGSIGVVGPWITRLSCNEMMAVFSSLTARYGTQTPASGVENVFTSLGCDDLISGLWNMWPVIPGYYRA